jgi:hypothetical protein
MAKGSWPQSLKDMSYLTYRCQRSDRLGFCGGDRSEGGNFQKFTGGKSASANAHFHLNYKIVITLTFPPQSAASIWHFHASHALPAMLCPHRYRIDHAPPTLAAGDTP